VGKTVTVRQFGERFDCYIELNLERQENRAPFVLQPFALFVSFVARSVFDF